MYLGEAGHAVVVGHFAGGDAVHQRVEQFPVGGVPADEGEAFGLGHATGVTGSVALVVLADGDWRCLR